MQKEKLKKDLKQKSQEQKDIKITEDEKLMEELRSEYDLVGR